jgi:hypothetical protein
MAAIRRDRGRLGVTTIAAKTYKRSNGTLGSESSAAQFALPTAIDGIHGDTIAGLQAGYIGRHLDYLAGKFVAEHKRHRSASSGMGRCAYIQRSIRVLVEIRMTNG